MEIYPAGISSPIFCLPRLSTDRSRGIIPLLISALPGAAPELVAEVVRRLQSGSEQALYHQLQTVLAGQLDIEKDGNLLGYYAFEMGLYRSLPLDVQRRLLIESNRSASPLSR